MVADRRTFLLATITVMGMALPPVGVWASVPINDDGIHATIIPTLPFSDALDTRDATIEWWEGPYSCALDDHSVWYSITPTSDVHIVADTSGSDYDTTLTVLSTCATYGCNLVNEGCGTTPTGSGLQMFFNAVVGNTYYIKVGARFGSPAGILHLRVAAIPTAAKMVFGQPYMSWNECNSLGLSAGSLCNPGGLVVASDVLYVADRGNHRVVAYEHPLTTDSEADHVFGQMDGMGTGTCNLGGVSQNSLCTPIGLAVDGAGNLFVADFNNHRVLEYDMPLTTDTEADMVFGQPDFMTATCNTGGVSANSLCNPRGPAVDQAGSLYVADGFVTSPRVLVFENPLVNTEADVVFGQPDFMTTGCNTGGISARSVCTPSATTFDAAGNLYLADQGNNRILIYFNPQTDVDPLEADLVIGQPDFSSGALYAASASSLNQALDLALDSLGNLYVSDTLNNRVLVYRTPPITDGVADLVYGQLDFTHASPNFNGTSAVSMRGPRGVALDADDNLYVSDLGNSRVLVYDTDADFDGLFGSRDGCPRQAPTRGIDTDHDGCTDTIAVLKTIVQGMTIEASLKNGLLGKLDEAQKALDRGSTQVAINKLQNFVDQVEGQRGKKINNSDADLLEAYAGNLITLFGP